MTIRFRILLAMFIIALGISSCRKELSFSENSAFSIILSADTITFDTVFTTLGSSTRQLMVYNNNKENIKINSIKLGNGSSSFFSINVDGEPGTSFFDKEIYAGDSLFIFIKVTIDPVNQNNPLFIEDFLVFNTNGNIDTVHLTAYGQDANYIIADRTLEGFPKFKVVADSLETAYWTAEKPYVVYGHALINSYGTLVIEAGARIYFHNGSGLWAWSEGQLIVNGTIDNPVVFQGDRLESFYQDKAGQWDRIWLMEAREGGGHYINYAIIKNGFIGIQAERFLKDNKAPLTITNTIITNHTGMGIYSHNYHISASNIVVANCGNYGLALTGGGWYEFTHGSFLNYWSASTRTTPNVYLSNIYTDPMTGNLYAYGFEMKMNNSIMYGSKEEEFNTDFYPGTDSIYTFNNSLVRTQWKSNVFNNCLLNKDPKILDYENYDYHLDTLSPAIGLGDPLYSTGILQMDLDGISRGNSPDAGAYQYVPTEEPSTR